MKTLFYKFFSTLASLFKGRNLLWQVAAILLSLLIVISGFDWTYFQATRFIGREFWLPAAVLGGLLPIIVPLTLLLLGVILKNKKVSLKGFVLGQAALMGYLVSIFYKSLTGRIPPQLLEAAGSVDTSLGWQFGFMRGGIFWGWPSSHTTVAFAMTLALIMLYPKNKIIRYLALIYALYIGLAVSISIHWFSEFVAGAIFGTIVGLAVAQAFKEKINAV